MNYASKRDRAGKKIEQYGTQFVAHITDRTTGALTTKPFSMLYLKKVQFEKDESKFRVGDLQYLAQAVEGYMPKEGDRFVNQSTMESMIVAWIDPISPGPVAVSYYVYLRRG